MNNTMDFEKQDKEYIANTYGRFNVCFEKGKGSLLWDVTGKEYIDLGSGIGVTAFGVDDDEWTEAVTKQSHALNHISNLYYSLPQIELAKQLCAKTGMKRYFSPTLVQSLMNVPSKQLVNIAMTNTVKVVMSSSPWLIASMVVLLLPCLPLAKMYSINISSHLQKALFIHPLMILMRP